MIDFMHADAIRTLFSTAMSDMYRKEVPLYGALIDLVREVNTTTLDANPALKDQLIATGDLERLDVERHGAIRLGKAHELATIRRMFAIMGMFPVSYYDLSVAGIPVHSTAFRPVEQSSLKRNPFRVFTSLLRLDLIADRALAAKAEKILDERQIVTNATLELIDQAEQQGGLTEAQAVEFVKEALETFRWHNEATVDAATYDQLVAAHRLIADVVSFKGPHINHLTPRTLDIDAVQAQMSERGITPKLVIEGPPRRTCDILLRQTSFKALDEAVYFQGEAGNHTARFGEIEQRGVALTPAGRARYDAALANVRDDTTKEGSDTYTIRLETAFSTIPDDLETLRAQSLAYFHYRVTGTTFEGKAQSLSDLVHAGVLAVDPQVYEDFLPVSAAGIFQSNLGNEDQSNYGPSANQSAFEMALDAKVIDEMALYASIETQSIETALAQLGQSHLLKTQ